MELYTIWINLAYFQLAAASCLSKFLRLNSQVSVVILMHQKISNKKNAGVGKVIFFLMKIFFNLILSFPICQYNIV